MINFKNLWVISLLLIALLLGACSEEEDGFRSGNNGLLSIDNVKTNSLTISWASANSTSETLEYCVYYSTNDNINTVVEVETNGIIFEGYAGDIISKDVTGLLKSENYYFNVIVKDAEGNKIVYKSIATKTHPYWQKLESSYSSPSIGYQPNMIINSLDILYIAFTDRNNDSKLSVVKYENGDWVYVGSAGFSAASVYGAKLAFNSLNIPYVVYKDTANDSKATVMKYNGTSWVIVGSAGFTVDGIGHPSIAIDSNDILHIAYEDDANSGKATVMKYDGTHWVNVGTPGFSASILMYPLLKFDSNNTAFVLYSDYSDPDGKHIPATAMKFNGSSWVTVGNAGFSAGQIRYHSMTIDSSDIPYVIYCDVANSQKSTVMKFNGSSWVNVGTAGFSPAEVVCTVIAVNDVGTPYVSFQDYSDPDGKDHPVSVMKYNGTDWISVGQPGISEGEAEYTSMVFDSTGTLYVAYYDRSSEYIFAYNTKVMKFN